MTKKSFLGGLCISFIVGIPIAMINELAGALVGVIIGSLFAASKKGGGAVGFLTTPWIYLSPYILPLLINYLEGQLSLLPMIILIGYALIDFLVLLILILGIIIGIIFGYLGLKIAKRE